MTGMSDAEKAEQLTKRRAKALPRLGALLLGQQAVYFTQGHTDTPTGSWHIAAWLVLSVAILVILATGGGWIYPRSVRRLANDEGTRVHRERAFRAGFVSSMTACVVLYFVSIFEPLSGREVIHIVMTSGVLGTLVWFGFLEWRAQRGD